MMLSAKAVRIRIANPVTPELYQLSRCSTILIGVAQSAITRQELIGVGQELQQITRQEIHEQGIAAIQTVNLIYPLP